MAGLEEDTILGETADLDSEQARSVGRGDTGDDEVFDKACLGHRAIVDNTVGSDMEAFAGTDAVDSCAEAKGVDRRGDTRDTAAEEACGWGILCPGPKNSLALDLETLLVEAWASQGCEG